eukprot:4232871-Pyramimonas_sp.AAC.1
MMTSGGPKYRTQWSATQAATTSAIAIFEPSGQSSSRRSTPRVSLNRKVLGSDAGGRGLGIRPLASQAG